MHGPSNSWSPARPVGGGLMKGGCVSPELQPGLTCGGGGQERRLARKRGGMRGERVQNECSEKCTETVGGGNRSILRPPGDKD